MILLVGLGNPGPKYANHRHNIGFMVVDEIADRWNFSPERPKFQGLVREGTLETAEGPVKALILKPTTYMNESGRAVGEAIRFYKLDLSQVVVFYDELDLAPGKVRVRTGGGLAGHNGMRSLKAHVGNEFRRVRLGIGHPGHKDAVTRHVLGDFSKADQAWLYPLIVALGEAAPLLAAGDDASYMNKVFLLTHPDDGTEKKDNGPDKKKDKTE